MASAAGPEIETMKCLASCCGALCYCLLGMTMLAPTPDAVDDWSFWGALEHGVEAAAATIDGAPWCVGAACSLLGWGGGGYVPGEADEPDEVETSTPASGAACSLGAPSIVLGNSSELSDDESERVVSYVAEQVLATGRTQFDAGEITEATGVVLDGTDPLLLRQRVAARLMESEAGRKLFAGSRCATYEACSVYGNLAGADAEVLAMYEREKKEDGRAFDEFELPAFTAHDLEGHEVSSADLLGEDTLLAFVAVHCQHSMDSLPILQRLHDTYGQEGLRVVAVAVGSGEVEDVNSWFPHFEPTYEVWVASGTELPDAIGSHLVPTYLFVDERGRITEKLVGFKESSAVSERALARLASGGEDGDATLSR